MFVCLNDINEDNLHLAKDVILDKMYHSILPFRVWNHLFMCNRLKYELNMCRFCTKTYIKHKKISYHINEKLFAQTDDYFPVQLRFGIVLAKNVNLFVYTNITPKNKVFKIDSNFGTLYYESINSSFLLWKFYLDILCRIVFNVSQKFVLPLILTVLIQIVENILFALQTVSI